MKYLVAKYPDAMISDVRKPNQESRKIADMTVDDYCVARVTEDIGETSATRVRGDIEGFLVNSFYDYAIGEDDQAAGYALLAGKIWARYQRETEKQKHRVGLPSLDEIRREALRQFDQTYNPILIAQLRTKLPGLPPPASAPPSSATNVPPAAESPGFSPKP